MNKFAFHKMENVRGKISFYRLEMDGVILIEEFENGLETLYEGQLATMNFYMDRIANMQLLPHAKFHSLDKEKEKTGTFEFKTKHLRIYGMSLSGGKIIILGGIKGTGQDQDIKKVKQIATAIKQQKISLNG